MEIIQVKEVNTPRLSEPQYTVELLQSRNAHFYRVDGRETLYPGSTTVLGVISKPALIPWAANQAAEKIKLYLMEHATGRTLTKEEISDLVEHGRKAHVELKEAAADIGTRAHQAINAIIDGGKMNLTDDIKPAVNAFMDFIGKSRVTIEHGDRKIASLKYGYGGSLDALGIEDGRFVIIDFKTSNAIYAEHSLQVASYAQAFQETYGLTYLPEAYILRLGKKKPDFEFRKVPSIANCLQGFLSALALYQFQKSEKFAA